MTAALTLGCNAPGSTDAGPDGGAPDASTPDASTADASTRDGSTADASTLDASSDGGEMGNGGEVGDADVVDADIVDADTVDADTVDADTVDADIVDADTVDAGGDDASTSDAGGADASACADECPASGATRCAGDAVQTCSDVNADPCLEWSGALACAASEVCGGGVCAASLDPGALTAAADTRHCQLSPAGDGATYVAWQQGPSGAREVYLQRLLGDGSVSTGWPSGGLLLSSAPDSQTRPQLVDDGAGGVLVVWTDFRGSPASFTTEQVYATRVRADGTFHPSWPVDGLRLSAGSGFSRSPALVSDGAGGLYAVWQHDPSSVGTYNRLYAQRVSGAAVLAWADVVPVTASVPVSTNQTGYTLLSDGAEGALVIWGHLYTTISHDVLGQRLSPAGARLWGDGGLTIADDRAEISPQAVSDGSGGAYVSFVQVASGDRFVHTQRLSSAGSLLWAPSAGGVRVCCGTGFFNVVARPTLSVGADVIVSWFDNSDINAARLGASSGSLVWGATNLHTETADSRNWISSSDGAEGHLSLWSERAGSDEQVFLQRLDQDGTRPPGWAAARPIGSGVGLIGMPSVAPDGVGGAWACWSRTIGGAPWELMTARSGL